MTSLSAAALPDEIGEVLTMYCVHCGHELPASAERCPSCAGEVPRPSAARPPSAAPRTGRWPVLIIVLAVLAIFIAIIVLIAVIAVMYWVTIAKPPVPAAPPGSAGNVSMLWHLLPALAVALVVPAVRLRRRARSLRW